MRGEFIDVGGQRLYYFAAGTRGEGEPVVLLHGLFASSHLWRELIRRAPEGHRLVVTDLLGHGRSDLPADADYSLGAHARRVLALLDDLGIERAALGGHHLGAAVAVQLALDHPERVTGLLLCDALVGAHQRLGLRLARALVARVGPRVPPTVLASLWHGTMLRGFVDQTRLGRRSIDVFLRPYLSPEGRDAMCAQLRALTPEAVVAQQARLRELRCPAVLVWGEDDPFIPATLGESLTDALPSAQIDVVQHMRHYTPEEAPDRVAAALRHLLAHSRHRGRAPQPSEP